MSRFELLDKTTITIRRVAANKPTEEVLKVDGTFGNPVVRILQTLAKRFGDPNNIRFGLSVAGKPPKLWFCVPNINSSTTEGEVAPALGTLLETCYPDPDHSAGKKADLWCSEHGKKMYVITSIDGEPVTSTDQIPPDPSSAESDDRAGTAGPTTIQVVAPTDYDPTTGLSNTLI